MRTINSNIIVEFDLNHNKVHEVGGIELIRPDEWLFEEVRGVQKWDVNRNKLQTNPQIAEVVIPNEKLNLKKGDKIFTHYLAIETGTEIHLDNIKCHIIKYNSVLFKIEQETYLPVRGIYLGEQVYTQGLQTESGIWITPYDTKKEAIKVKITHVPEDSQVKVGDIVITPDGNQYEFELNGKKIVKLMETEIIGYEL